MLSHGLIPGKDFFLKKKKQKSSKKFINNQCENAF